MMSAMTDNMVLRMRASATQYERWAACPDRKAAMEPAWRGREARWLTQARETRPDLKPGRDDRELERVAEMLRKAFYQRLSAAGLEARQRKAASKGRGKRAA